MNNNIDNQNNNETSETAPKQMNYLHAAQKGAGAFKVRSVQTKDMPFAMDMVLGLDEKTPQSSANNTPVTSPSKDVKTGSTNTPTTHAEHKEFNKLLIAAYMTAEGSSLAVNGTPGDNQPKAPACHRQLFPSKQMVKTGTKPAQQATPDGLNFLWSKAVANQNSNPVQRNNVANKRKSPHKVSFAS